MTYLSASGVAALGGGLIAITYGLARFVFGLFLPVMREDMAFSPTVAGLIGALPFLSFTVAILLAPRYTRLLGIRYAAVGTSALALLGLLTIAHAPSPIYLALGVLVCGISTGLSTPVMPDVVHRCVKPQVRGRVNATINSGTSLGIAFAMPAVLLLAGQWRLAYLSFALVAAAGVVAALVYLPGGSIKRSASRTASSSAYRVHRPWRKMARLCGLAAAMGLVSSIVWVFAPDAAIQRGGLQSSQTAWMWFSVGVAGLLGSSAGDLIDRFGSAFTHALGLAVMSVAVGLLAMAPGDFGVAMLAAAAFGASYMMLSSFYLIQGTRILPNEPAYGPVLPFLAVSCGQILGSTLAGMVIGTSGYQAAFSLYALLGIVVTILSVPLARMIRPVY
ncbi:MFS transporter [Saccharospirillum salsuginis]|uniref:MFS transporter n=1 Tax=Saccharospirillum salsuginis TaxID=418750 RepID=A0A918K6Y6_9GAMM|nr:MFS transporter [Saccharospirillum salsuginis]GGX52885.1 MFS transporter [Saccharospirillum salsuginis]